MVRQRANVLENISFKHPLTPENGNPIKTLPSVQQGCVYCKMPGRAVRQKIVRPPDSPVIAYAKFIDATTSDIEIPSD